MAPILAILTSDHAARQLLTEAFVGGNGDAIRAACRDLMYHSPLHSRAPAYSGHLYRDILPVTGPPRRLLDIACGLNPLAFPWMGLPPPEPILWPTTSTSRGVDFPEPLFHLAKDYRRWPMSKMCRRRPDRKR